MKKLIAAAFILVSICVLAITSHAAENDDYIGKCECAISVDDAGDSAKVEKIDAAATEVMSGTSPENTSYFSGTTRRRSIPDGYYTVSETSTEMCFNVAADGADNDYEGIPLTVWENTEDVTQRFRFVMNEDGSFTFFAACSKGGYSRAVGYDADADRLGLYSPEDERIASFFIKKSSGGNGMKYIVLSTDETKYLAIPKDPVNADPAVICSFDDEHLFEWKIANWGDGASSGDELALYPANILKVTQGPFGEFSHQNQNAIDMQVNDGDSIVAPFTCRVTAVNEESGNVVWVESLSKVIYADGSYDYMTCLFMHDDDISDIYVGEIILQGQPFYDMGTAGYAEGKHCHISCFRGKYSESMKIECEEGDANAVLPYDAFFLPKDITMYLDEDLPWIYEPERN
ncbi:MAG: hypothetical protein IKN38_06485 [Clostridia bacterium]|nr:hypothetical protein [Clostridia bacterium]